MGGVAACRRRSSPRARSCAVAPRGAAAPLTADQRTTLAAACARIIPTDEDPGATEADVATYIEAQLALPQFKTFAALFGVGLRKLDQLARAGHGQPFHGCPAAAQDAVLRRVERGVRLGRRSSRQFFRVLLTFTLEGFLGDPVYGGNRGRVGWRLIGFTPRPPRPRCPYTGA